jgi:hypothetical protein
MKLSLIVNVFGPNLNMHIVLNDILLMIENIRSKM